MIKRNIFAIVITAAFLAGTVNAAEIYNKDGNKLDLYGKVSVRQLFSKNSGSDDDSRVRFGIKGDTQISDQLTGFGRFEWEIKTNKSEAENKNTNSLAYVGLKIADFSSLDYGRNYGVLYDVNTWTNVLPLYGGDSMSQADSYLTGRNLLTYRNTDFFGLVDGLNFALQYQGKNTKSNKSGSLDYLKNNADGFSVAANYDIGWGVALGAGYAKFNPDIDITDANKDLSSDGGNSADSWNAGIKYDANNLYLAAMYGETRNMTHFDLATDPSTSSLTQVANKTENFELVGQYLFDEIGLKPSIAYVQSKGKNLTDTVYSQKQDLMKYVSLGAFYYFNKNLTAVVDYKINLVNSNGFTKKYAIGSDNLVGLGLVYQF
ncbi:MAG: porin [Arsenophonus sp. NEOnobi-MAG3]